MECVSGSAARSMTNPDPSSLSEFARAMPSMDESTVLSEMAEFLRWGLFEIGLKHDNRHFPLDQPYFTTLFQACLACRHVLPKGTVLHRGRIMPANHPGGHALPIEEMRQPPPEKAQSQRLSPEGIPCFYAAFERATAIAELRPWRKAEITVATFTTTRDLDVLDLRRHPGMLPPAAALAYVVGRPVHREDRFAYLGTQYLAERIKAAGIAGLLYDTALGPLAPERGTNVALFSDGALANGTVSSHQVEDVSYTTLNEDTLERD
jgi:hypothetical protein